MLRETLLVKRISTARGETLWSGMGYAVMESKDEDIWLLTSSACGQTNAQAGGLLCRKVSLDPSGENPVECLFGQPDAAPARHVIALLDAASIFGLPEILESSGLDHVPLFQSGAQNSGPVLIELLPNARLTRQLLAGRARPSSLLRVNAGIYFRTTMDMDSLRGHLRRLMRVSDDQGRLYFFRFWETWAAQCFFEQIQDKPARLLHWFKTVEGHLLGEILVPDTDAGCMTIFGIEGFENAIRPHTPLRLDAGAHQALQQRRLRADLRQIMDLIGATFPDAAGKMGRQQLEREVTRSVRRMQDFGIRQRDNLLRLACWDLHSDGRFEGRDTQGLLREICASPMPETQKMIALTARIAELD